MSANGFPSCSKSSEVFAGAGLPKSLPLASWTGASNRSTIGAALAVGGDAKKGFVDGLIPPGDDTFDCCKGEKSRLIGSQFHFRIVTHLELIHHGFLFSESLRLDRVIDSVRVVLETRGGSGSSERGASRRQDRHGTLYVSLVAIVSNRIDRQAGRGVFVC